VNPFCPIIRVHSSIAKDIAERMLPHAATRIGIPHSELKKRLEVRLGRSKDINAYANAATTRITINASLMVFYHKMLKVFVATLSVGDKTSGILGKPTISPDRILSAQKRLLQADSEDSLLTTEGFQLKELDAGQRTVLVYLVRSCECFAVGHELGHVVINRTKGNVPEYDSSRAAVRDFLESIDDLSSAQRRELIEPWTNEVCADLIGLQLSLAQPKIEPYSRWGDHKEWICAGAEITRLLDLMREEFDDRLNHGKMITFVNTHPHDYLRWKAIRSSSEYKAACGDSSLGDSFRTFTGVLDDIFEETDIGVYKLRATQ
jgi:hypothetical protein